MRAQAVRVQGERHSKQKEQQSNGSEAGVGAASLRAEPTPLWLQRVGGEGDVDPGRPEDEFRDFVPW